MKKIKTPMPDTQTKMLFPQRKRLPTIPKKKRKNDNTVSVQIMARIVDINEQDSINCPTGI